MAKASADRALKHAKQIKGKRGMRAESDDELLSQVHKKKKVAEEEENEQEVEDEQERREMTMWIQFSPLLLLQWPR